MTSKKTNKHPDYVAKAIVAFNELMSDRKKIMEAMNRTNKGELFVLHFLSMGDTAVYPSELSEALCCSMSRISALLGSLEKKGQIEREIDKSNRRNILITITDAGRERVRVEVNGIEQILANVFIEMGESDTAEHLRLFKKFSEIVQKYLNDTVK